MREARICAIKYSLMKHLVTNASGSAARPQMNLEFVSLVTTPITGMCTKGLALHD